jgi:Trk-type K+ transport system membrane component
MNYITFFKELYSSSNTLHKYVFVALAAGLIISGIFFSWLGIIGFAAASWLYLMQLLTEEEVVEARARANEMAAKLNNNSTGDFHWRYPSHKN